MITQTNTSGVSFVVENVVGQLQSTNTTNAATSLPAMLALEPQVAIQQGGRNPGGQAYRKGANIAYIPPNSLGTVVANTNAGCVLLDGFEMMAARLGTTKSGAALISVNANTAVNLNLTNTAVNTNSQAGDTVFANWNQLIFYNLTGMGIDNSSAGVLTVLSSNTNGANIGATPVNALGGYVVQAGGAAVAQSLNTNTAIAANSLNCSVNCTTAGLVAIVICGS